MGKYLLKRLWQSVIAILGITVVVFVILHLTGNPVELMVSPTTPKEEMEILAEKMGFNDPLPVQYVRFLKGALVGDFGTSYYYNEPAMQVVLERAPATLTLACAALLICVVLGTIVAYLMVRRPSVLIRVVESIISVPYSIPGIILGLALILTWASPLPIIHVTIYATVFMLLVSYVVRFTSLQIRNSTTGVLQTDISMEEAAEICGATAFKKWTSVIIPLIFPATVSGMGLVFLNALTELTTSSLLWSAGSETLVAVRVGEKLITVKELGSTHYGGDEVVYLSFDPRKINVFDAKSENLIKYCR